MWTAVILILLAWIKAEKEWTTFLVLLLAAALGYVPVYATPVLQVGVAAGLVWLLLLGGVRDAVESGTDDTSDAAKLARDTFDPAPHLETLLHRGRRPQPLGRHPTPGPLNVAQQP